MDLTPDTKMRGIAIDTVFLRSCTNSRIEDLRLAADVLKGRHIAASTRMLVVPGSARVRLQAMEEGPDEIGSRFADIFRNNSANNGLLLAQVDSKVVGELWDFAEQHPGEQLTLSLENRTINLPGRTTYPFHIDDVTRQRLLAGLDAVGETLEHADDIAAYEAHRPSFMPTTS